MLTIASWKISQLSFAWMSLRVFFAHLSQKRCIKCNHHFAFYTASEKERQPLRLLSLRTHRH